MKKIAAILLSLSMIFSLCACGGTPSNSSTDQTPGNSSSGTGNKATYELIMASHETAASDFHAELEKFADELSEKTDGRLKLTIYPGGSLGSAPDELNMLEEGSCDIIWTTPALNAGVFPVMELVVYAGYPSKNNLHMTEAVNYLVENEQVWADQVANYHLVAIHQVALNPLTSTVKVETTDDFKKLTVRANSQSYIDLLTGIGASTMTANVNDTFEYMEKNVLNACINDWNILYATKLWEAAKYVSDYDFGSGAGMLLMNMDSYNGMPEDLREVFDEVAAGMSDRLAQVFYNCYDKGVAAFTEGGGEVYTFSDDAIAAIEASASAAIAKKIEELNAAGFDGQGLYEQLVDALNACADKY